MEDDHGNRGKCAQPCRLPYSLVQDDINSNSEKTIDKGYLISPKDLCSLQYLPSLINAGITCFKIEGRLKSPEYVATVTRIYRKYIDKIMAGCTNYQIDEKDMIPNEEVVVLITKDGYVKRTSKRGYNANTEDPLLKEGDYIIGLFKQNTIDTLLVFTNLGNYLFLPVHEIPDIKWKMLGKHISNIVKLSESEEVISAIPVKDFNLNIDIAIASKDGMIKRTSLKDFKVSRYSKPITCMKLKDNDKVVNAFVVNHSDVFVATNNGYGLWFDIDEVPVSGIKSGGVKSISLRDDFVVSAFVFDNSSEYVTIFTSNRTAKRVKLEEFEKSSRARRGLVLLREVKTNPYKVMKVFITQNRGFLGIKKSSSIENIKNTEITIADRYKTGSTISKEDIIDVFEIKNLEEELVEASIEIKERPSVDSNEVKVHQVSLIEIDEQLKEIDDFLK